MSKLEETPARIALIVHLAKCVIGGGDQSTLDESSMVAGIQIAEWFIQETERIYQELGMDAPEDETTELVELILVNGGEMSARELQHASRKYRGGGLAGDAFDNLRKKGLGKLHTINPDYS